jgi:hypothetical protein
MTRYRKKPVVIEAMQLSGPAESLAICMWMEESGFHDFQVLFADGTMRIGTREGDHRADIGDFIIRGVAGEFYPCKPDIFEQTYEPVVNVSISPRA